MSCGTAGSCALGAVSRCERDAIVGQVVNGLALPPDALVSIVEGGDEPLLPRGSTRIEAGDQLYIPVRDAARPDVERLFGRWRKGPLERPSPGLGPVRSHAAPSTVRPWDPADGDYREPRRVAGIPWHRPCVAARKRRRAAPAGKRAVRCDEPGMAAVGDPAQLFRYCRRRIRRADREQERAWWQEVTGAISERSVR